MTKRTTGDMSAVTFGKRTALLILTVLFLFSVTAFAAPSEVFRIYIWEGTEVQTITTIYVNPDDILRQADITLFDGDVTDTSNFKPADGGIIRINRGVRATVITPDGKETAINVYGTVADALKKAGVEISEGLHLSYGLYDTVTDGMVIDVLPIYTVVFKADGGTTPVSVYGRTVGDALASVSFAIGENDIVSPAAGTALFEGMEITVSRVTIVAKAVTEKIPYETVYETSDDLYVNQTSVTSRGKAGVKEVSYNYVYTDGKLTDKIAVSETVVTEAQNRVVLQGTKAYTKTAAFPAYVSTTNTISAMALPGGYSLDSNGLPANYQGCIRAKATAYSGGGITSTGKAAQTGYVAVDPKEIPYGTEMYIISADGKYVYGYCIAADTGGYIYSVDWTIDLYMDTEYECVQWGRRDIIVYFL